MSELAPSPPPTVAPFALAACVACVAGAAALADCAVLAALLKRSRTGLYSIIMQLAMTDIILLGTVIGPELWSLNSRTWQFGNIACTAHQGLSVFTTTLTTYLVSAMALHTLTTIRLEEKSTDRKIKRSRDDDEEIRSSQHSLVANSDSSTPPRTMNLDYRVADTGIPVTLPTVFVWILAISLSIPEFALATTVHAGKNVIICTLDSSHQFNMHIMLAAFNLFLPLFIMSSAAVLIIVKLFSKRRPSGVDNNESVAALKLSLWLISVHVILCTPRAVLTGYRVYSTSISGYDSAPDLYLQSNTITVINLALSSAYLSASLIRPILCIIVIQPLKVFFSFGAKIPENV
ncbi:uncharacterized protein LOC126377172 [Pectinophora gossypiella]|uniref:uncharacterized protein LOC126377172 n=1 Tax=Pectinophora gossypiella TaxID=13191 RepID=UPI00214F341B|nr:uncharacterized protein LOC126377172 [Pectinophora gossypiella]